MQAWRIHSYGRPSQALRLDTLPEPEPAPGQVRIRVQAAGLNFNDVDMCHGRYPTIDPPLPFTLGMEVTGVVDVAGAGAEAWLGERVVATPLGGIGGYAECALAGADSVFRAPPGLDPTQAAAFMIPFHTAHLALHRRGRLEAGESLLVHAGAGGVGSAAVQLGVAAGARVFATAGGPEKVAFCNALGPERVIDYRSEDFVRIVLEETGGRGVDVVCDLVGGELAERSWQCIAREGRYLIAGFSGDIAAGEAGLPPRPVAKGNFSLIGVMMAWIDAPEGALRGAGVNPFGRDVGEEVHEALLQLLAAGRIRPLVGATCAFDELPAALEAMEERRTRGRSILRVDA